MKNLILLSAILFSSITLIGQDNNNKLANTKNFGVNVNYFTQGFEHSGVEIGMESAILKNLIMSYHVGFYFIKDNEPDVALYWEMAYRPTFNNSGYSPEVSAGIGYLTTYIPATSTDNQEELKIVYYPSITLGLLGYDFRNTKNIPLRLFGNVMFYWKNPINKKAIAYTGFQVGATYFIK